MGFFSQFFGKGIPDPLTVSNRFDDAINAIFEYYGKTLYEGKSTPALLAAFTLTNSFITSRNLLNFRPKAIGRIERITCETRAYFDCLWQLDLLNRYLTDAEQKKISTLYANVDLIVMALIRRMKQDDALFDFMLGKASSADYFNIILKERIKAYIWGHSPGDPEENIYLKNTKYFGNIILAEFAKESIDVNEYELLCLIANDTANALKQKFLTEFDLNRCEIIKFPDEFYT